MTETNGGGLLAGVRDRIAQLRNTLGEPLELVADPLDGSLRAAAPNGRLVVAAGQTIASAWGNTTYDQTMQTYATAADRTNQWPAPQEGALSFLMDSHTPWMFRSGAWHPLPLGFLATASGPAAQTNYGATMGNVATLTAAVTAGRRYRFSAYINGTQITSAGNARATFQTDDFPAGWWVFNVGSLAVGGVGTGSPAVLYTPATTRTTTFTMTAATAAGSFQVNANAGTITLEDVGG